MCGELDGFVHTHTERKKKISMWAAPRQLLPNSHIGRWIAQCNAPFVFELSMPNLRLPCNRLLGISAQRRQIYELNTLAGASGSGSYSSTRIRLTSVQQPEKVLNKVSYLYPNGRACRLARLKPKNDEEGSGRVLICDFSSSAIVMPSTTAVGNSTRLWYTISLAE